MIRPHLSISELRNAASWTGVEPITMTPPCSSFSLAAGYHEIGRQYQALLARAGVRLRLVATAGTVENLALLRDPHFGVNIALVQGGSVGEAAGEVESLGTLFYEPLWIFHRGDLEGATLAALRGRKVSIGPVGSGSHALLPKLLKRNDVYQDVVELLALPPQEAADK